MRLPEKTWYPPTSTSAAMAKSGAKICCALLTLASGYVQGPSKVILSGYMEGAGHRAITLMNNGCNPVPLNEYQIRVYNNGNREHTKNNLVQFPMQQLVSGATFTVCSGDDLVGNPMCDYHTETTAHGDAWFDGLDCIHDVVTLWANQYDNTGGTQYQMIQNLGEIGTYIAPQFFGTMCRRVALGSSPGGSWGTAAWACEPDAVAGYQASGMPPPTCGAPALICNATVSSDLTLDGVTVAGFDAAATQAVVDTYAARFQVDVTQVDVSDVRPWVVANTGTTATVTIQATAVEQSTVQDAFTAMAASAAEQATLGAVLSNFGNTVTVTAFGVNPTSTCFPTPATPAPTAAPTEAENYLHHGPAHCPKGYIISDAVHEAADHGSYTIDPRASSPTGGLAHSTCVKCPAGQTSNGGYTNKCHSGYSQTWETCSHVACAYVNAAHDVSHCRLHSSVNPALDMKSGLDQMPGWIDLHHKGDGLHPQKGKIWPCNNLNRSPNPWVGDFKNRIQIYHHGHEEVGTEHRCAYKPEVSAYRSNEQGTYAEMRGNGEKFCQCKCRDPKSTTPEPVRPTGTCPGCNHHAGLGHNTAVGHHEEVDHHEEVGAP
jgi:hypothetical protein